MKEALSIIIGVLGLVACVAFLIKQYVSKRKKELTAGQDQEKGGR